MQIKDRQQFLTVLAVAAVALLLLDKMILPPLTAFWKDRNQQIKDLRTKVDNGEWLMKNKNKIRGRWAAIEAAALTNNISSPVGATRLITVTPIGDPVPPTAMPAES